MKYSKAIYSVKQTRKIEEYLIQESKIPEFDLMYEAGKAVFDILESKLATCSKKPPIFVISGSGNNGGDAYIMAALASKKGYDVCCLEIGCFSGQSEVSKKAKKLAQENFVNITTYDKNITFPKKAIIIDGILGIGIKGEVRAKQAELIKKINKAKAFIIAIDNP